VKNLMQLLMAAFFVTASLQPSLHAQQTAPDNTKTNRAPQPTADQAKNDKSDDELTKEIRQAIVKDKSLSTYAHNIKIVANQGKVTLRGPVRSEEEKKSIEDKATQIAGSGNVTNELSVSPNKS